MPQVASPISTSQTYIPLFSKAQLGRAAGVMLHFADLTALNAAVTAEKANILASSAIWDNYQPFRLATESLNGAFRVWNASAQHARTVWLAPGNTVVLASDAANVLTTTGAPSGGTGADGDIAVDWAANLYYTKSGGSWSVTSQVRKITAAGITDASAIGRQLLQAADQAAVQAIVGAVGGGPVDSTIIQNSTNAVAGGAVFTGLAAKLNSNGGTMVNGTIQGVTLTGTTVVTPYTVPAAVLDTSKPMNVKAVTGDTTFTFNLQPASNTKFMLRLSNTSGAARVITLPANCFSVALQATRASFSLSNNSQYDIEFEWDGSKYLMQGDPVPLSNKGMTMTFPDGGNDETPFTVHAPHPGTIVNIVSQCDSGTATYTTRINGVAIAATPNAVSTAKDQRVPSSVTSFAIGDKITVVRSANSSCVNGSITVIYAPVSP